MKLATRRINALLLTLMALGILSALIGCASHPQAPFANPAAAQNDPPPSDHPCARANWMYARETNPHTRALMWKVMKLHKCGLSDTW
jgi:hypothetical protein